MTGFLEITSVRVPHKYALEAHAHLQSVGLVGKEGFALWVGVPVGGVFNVEQTYIPAQQGLTLPGGVCVTVGADELHRLNVWLYRAGMEVIAQIHSHPNDAYHSRTDDTYPIATMVGALSLVVPYFAHEAFSLAQCAVYRLDRRGTWELLPTAAARRLISIAE